MSNAYSGTDNLEVMAEAVNYNRFLVELAGSQIRRSEKILDFGAGIGTFAKQFRDRGVEVVCVEPDCAQREILQREGFSVAADLGGVEDESIDYIYSLNVLEHIEDDVAEVKALFKKLKPGGHVFFYVPAMAVLYSSMDEKVGHVRRYSLSGLRALVEASGFTLTTARYADSLGVFATLLYKLLGGDGGEINRSALIVYDRIAFPLSRLLDFCVSRWFGKNVYAIAEKRAGW